jgi:cyclopropane fatty-acyl-phospholipid synthase-like methyltransferase
MTDGSYTFDQFTVTSQEREMARLQHQATLLLPIESRIWTLVGLQDGMQVVDVGCGAGIISGEIARNIPNVKVWGIDRSTALLSAAGFSQIETRLEVVASDRLGRIGRFWELLSFGNPYHSIDPNRSADNK